MATMVYRNFDKNVLVTGAYDTADEQETITLPSGFGAFLVQLVPVGGTARIESSLDGTNWEAWAAGEVSVSTTVPARPVTYLRVFNTTAASSALTVWGY